MPANVTPSNVIMGAFPQPPDPASGIDYAYAKPTEFFRDVVHSRNAEKTFDRGLKDDELQRLDTDAIEQQRGVVPLLVSPTPLFTTPKIISIHPSQPSPRQARNRKIGRPRKTGPKPALKPDGRRRTVSGPLTGEQRRDILDAVNFSEDEGEPMTTTIDLHPVFMDTYPTGDLRDWFRLGPWRQAGQWLERHGVEWRAFATAENYEGDRRQHFHLVCACPACLRPELASTLRSCFPGDARTIKVGVLKADGVTYRIKQSAGNAVGPPRPGRPTPEKVSRWDGSPVADVDGKRYFLSRSVSRPTRIRSGWQDHRDEARAVARIDRAMAKARTEHPVEIEALAA